MNRMIATSSSGGHGLVIYLKDTRVNSLLISSESCPAIPWASAKR